MNIGIFGGTFDPPHIGHVKIAEYILNTKRMDKIIFVPAAIPPHKTNKHISSFQDRFNMLKMAIKREPRFEVSDIENNLGKPSFTIETLNRFRLLFCNDNLYVIIGADSLLLLHTWHRAVELVKKYEFITYKRPNENVIIEELNKNWDLTLSQKLYNSIINAPELFNISSTEIREKIRNNKLEVKNFLDTVVLTYIKNNKLYSD